MKYVMSHVVPPVGGAAFGQAKVTERVPSIDWAAQCAALVLRTRHSRTVEDAKALHDRLIAAPTGTDVTDEPTGLVFRIDTVEDAPHACPCCGRLVLPTDHAYAHADDAYCLGCFTWDRNVPQCLPENSAHQTGETFTRQEGDDTCRNGSPSCTPEDPCVICHDEEN